MPRNPRKDYPSEMSSHELARRLLAHPDVDVVVADGCCDLIPPVSKVHYLESYEQARAEGVSVPLASHDGDWPLVLLV